MHQNSECALMKETLRNIHAQNMIKVYYEQCWNHAI